MRETEAQALTDFLIPMLAWYPEKRATAQEMLSHPWLYMESNYDYKMNDKEYRHLILKQKITEESPDSNAEMNILGESTDELNYADLEDNFESEDSDRSLGRPPSNENVANQKYSVNSKLLNIDHGPNPQFQGINTQRIPPPMIGVIN